MPHTHYFYSSGTRIFFELTSLAALLLIAVLYVAVGWICLHFALLIKIVLPNVAPILLFPIAAYGLVGIWLWQAPKVVRHSLVLYARVKACIYRRTPLDMPN